MRWLLLGLLVGSATNASALPFSLNGFCVNGTCTSTVETGVGTDPLGNETVVAEIDQVGDDAIEISRGSSRSSIAYSIAATGFRISMVHEEEAPLARAFSIATLLFSATQNATFELSGVYDHADEAWRAGVRLYDATADEYLVLSSDDAVGASGELVAGHRYRLRVNGSILNPYEWSSPNSATGSVEFAIVPAPVPEPAAALLLSIGLAALAYSRPIQPSVQSVPITNATQPDTRTSGGTP